MTVSTEPAKTLTAVNTFNGAKSSTAPSTFQTSTQPNLSQPTPLFDINNSNTIFEADFENHAMIGFRPYSGDWSIVPDLNNNQVLQQSGSDGYPYLPFGPEKLTNGVIQFKIRWLEFCPDPSGPITLDFRNNEKARYLVVLSPCDQNARFIYWEAKGTEWQEPEKVLSYSSEPFAVNKDEWVNVKILFHDDVMQLYINEQLQQAVRDRRLSTGGGMNIVVFPNTTVQFDDFVIREIGTPGITKTPMPIQKQTYTPSPIADNTITNPTIFPTLLADLYKPNEFVFADDFNINSNLGSGQNTSKSNGILMIGKEGNSDGFFDAKQIISAGTQNTFIVLFKLEDKSQCTITLSSGDWGTTNYRRWGAHFDNNIIQENIEYGSEPEYLGGTIISNSVLKKDYWFFALLQIRSEGQFRMKIWDPKNPSTITQYDRTFKENWKNQSWFWDSWCGKGKLFIDEYYELKIEE